MKVVFHRSGKLPLNEMTIEWFADRFDLSLQVYERDPDLAAKKGRFFCYFANVEVQEQKGFLTSATGNGETILIAVDDYCKEISNKTLVINAMDPESRTEVMTSKITPQWTMEAVFEE
jgi:hypothetical protein